MFDMFGSKDARFWSWVFLAVHFFLTALILYRVFSLPGSCSCVDHLAPSSIEDYVPSRASMLYRNETAREVLDDVFTRFSVHSYASDVKRALSKLSVRDGLNERLADKAMLVALRRQVDRAAIAATDTHAKIDTFLELSRIAD